MLSASAVHSLSMQWLRSSAASPARPSWRRSVARCRRAGVALRIENRARRRAPASRHPFRRELTVRMGLGDEGGDVLGIDADRLRGRLDGLAPTPPCRRRSSPARCRCEGSRGFDVARLLEVGERCVEVAGVAVRDRAGAEDRREAELDRRQCVVVLDRAFIVVDLPLEGGAVVSGGRGRRQGRARSPCRNRRGASS